MNALAKLIKGPGLPRFVMNWKNPDYAGIFQQRMDSLNRLRAMPEDERAAVVEMMKGHYRKGPDGYSDFINDWGVTYDPRNVEIGLPALLPFVLFDKQRDMFAYFHRKWMERKPGLVEKSRDVGATWGAMAWSCTVCLFNDGVAIGFGSRKGEYVDKPGTQKPMLPKGRMFMEHLPDEFRGGWVSWRDAPNMRINFPETGSLIAGEGGDDIGRGDRTSIYFVDEAAHLERPELIEASLSATTNCRIDMSSVKGMANPFAVKRHSGRVEPFIFDWRDDPRKDEAWYDKQVAELDPVVVAQEIDRNYSASVKGIVIPGDWVRSAFDALRVLGLNKATGDRRLAFDIADEGEDKNAICEMLGVEVVETEEWSGKGSDTFDSTEYVMDVCEERGIWKFRYDGDGIGASIRGDARVLNERRQARQARAIAAIGYRGSAAVVNPEGIVEGTIGHEGDRGRTNEDYFHNFKAQAWWHLRLKFQRTHRWVQSLKRVAKGELTAPLSCPVDQIISIRMDPAGEYLHLAAELSQATFKQNDAGKMLINKKGGDPNKKGSGGKSPNRADALVMANAPMDEGLQITGDVLAQVAAAGRRRR